MKNPYRIINRALRDTKSLAVATGDWGVTDRGGYWDSAGNCACPLGMCLLGTKVRKGDNQETAAARLLSQPVAWVRSFVDGVDGNKHSAIGHKKAYDFGKRIRDKYVHTVALP